MAAGLLCGLLSLAAWANPYLQEGRALFADLKADEAIARLEIARRVTTNTRAEKKEILELLGRAHLALNHRPESEAAFSELLELDPSTELGPRAAPKLRTLFGLVKTRMFAADYVVLRRLPAPEGEVRLSRVDPWNQSTKLSVFVRANEGWDAAPSETDEDTVVASVLPGTAWYAELTGKSGQVLARISEEPPPVVVLTRPAPPKLSAPPPMAPRLVTTSRRPEPPSVWARPRTWGFVTAGITVLAAGTGSYLQVQSLQSDRASRTATWSDQARNLHDESTDQARWATGFFIATGVAAATSLALFVW
jgi:hypothetical protein